MAQAAFRLLLPDSGTSCVSHTLAHLLLLIPASPQHMANSALNSSFDFCMHTTFVSLLLSSRSPPLPPEQHRAHLAHHLPFSPRHSDLAIPSRKQVHQTPLHSQPFSFSPWFLSGTAAHETCPRASSLSLLQTHRNGMGAVKGVWDPSAEFL